MKQASMQLIEHYYAAFNAGDMETFLGLLSNDVIHDINQGAREIGKEAFTQFMVCMNTNYKEQVKDLVVMVNDKGNRAAAEFLVVGEYHNNARDLPEAKGQPYRLIAGAFFAIQDNKIARISSYYNLDDWITQVSG